MKRGYTPRTPCRTKSNNQKETLQVYCRLRPTVAATELACVRMITDTTVALTVPESAVNFRPGSCKEYQYTFKRVFSESSTQKEIFDDIALPLVEQLIQGRNGLLFTYGVTGSGKTYTMTGAKHNSGIMPRCLDVLFNSIADYQARKYVFKPDKMNGFEVQSEDDAKQERDDSAKNAAIGKYGRLRKKESYEDLTSSRSREELKVTVEEDNAFAVFITYVEIYNNNVYDLLENLSSDIGAKSQIKIIREDASRNMYVHGVTEVEVKSAEEAFEVFYKGQNRKRMAHTSLNNESSRSHSIFTIRLVQAPLDMNGETVLQDKKFIGISQLSLVDLAGSERTNRTRNQGQRLREAGNINNSLMTLRNCLEILRESQATGNVKMAPYRDSRLTHLFKNFFEGEGNIRMIVCVNPRIDDYDENIQVMKFSEASQEILVKPTPMKTDFVAIGLTPGRRRANQAYKKARQILEEVKESNIPPYIPNDAEIIYSFNPFPSFDNIDQCDPDYHKNLIAFLENRLKKKEFLRSDCMARAEKFRAALVEREEIFFKLKQDCDAANARLEFKDSKTKVLEDKLVSLDSFSSTLKKKCEDYVEEIQKLRRELELKENVICQYTIEKDKEKQRTRKMAAKTEKLAKEKECNLKEKKNIEMQLKDRENRLRRVKKVLDMNEENARKSKIPRIHSGYGSDSETSSVSNAPLEPAVLETPKNTQRFRPRTVNTIAVSNPRYGNKRCNTHDHWLEHKPAILAPLNTVLQPVLKKRKSVTTITSPKEVTKTSKYCLITQSQDAEGVLETHLFKGDVIPGPGGGGGAQVIFNDVETLKQTSPTTSPRKDLLDEINSSIATRAARFV